MSTQETERIDQRLLDLIGNVEELANILKADFVSKDELTEMLITCAIAQEHLLVLGPPGTAKSELVKRFALYCSPAAAVDSQNSNVAYFEYLLTRFTEPNEIFGPIDIRAFETERVHRRVVDNMLPRAEIAFLDEVFKANSAILNALLTILNERVFYNGDSREEVPLLCAIAASNEVPEDSNLAALYDRFLVRVWSDNVEESRFPELFQRGWKLEKRRIQSGYGLGLDSITSTAELRELHRALDSVSLNGIEHAYREVVRRIRAEGVELSDRRVIKLLKLIAASALRRKSLTANHGDFWVLKHAWNNPDQIPHLEAIIEPYIRDYQQNRWSAERDLEIIGVDIFAIEADEKELRTDADYADFLQRADQLRRELMGHSQKEEAQKYVVRLTALIESAMNILATLP